MKYEAKLIDGKMMLISRDIQVGDMVRSDSFLEREAYYAGAAEVHRRVAARLFKIIGAISSEATYVKEGDKFDKNSINVWVWDGEDEWNFNIEEWKEEIEEDHSYEEMKIEIKGPCGHFH